MSIKTKILFIFIFTAVQSGVFAQSVVLDEIVGVVGKNQILYSEIEDQYQQLKAQGVKPMPSKCHVFEELLSQKLLANQAEVDSLKLEETTVEIELDDRIKYFVRQIGSEQKLIEYFGKSILEIKEDMRDAIRDQLLMQMMRREITNNISATPFEVQDYFNQLAPDSIPDIGAEVVLNQISIYPPSNEQALFDVREKLLKLRERIINGENFATLAVLYSEDPGTSSKGGEIGWTSKGELDAAYIKAAYALKTGQVSKIVETAFGFHLIQLLEREDERIHTRHILMKPKISPEEKKSSLGRMDSIVQLIRLDTLTFEKAAIYFSQDEDTRMNGGLMVNPQTGDTRFGLDQFESKEYYIIRNLKVGEISEVFETVDDKGKLVFKVLRLKHKSEPHKANFNADFNLLKQLTMQYKQNEVVDKWVEDKLKNTYVKINGEYKDCDFRIKGWKKE